MRRIGTLILCAVLLLGMLPLHVYAAAGEEISAEYSDLSVEGTNGLGVLLASDIEQEQAEETEGTGCSLLRLDISGNTATVELRTLMDAVLLVSIYSEDGLQLLASGKTNVCAEDSEVTVAVYGDMPEYFMASAYLLDPVDASPLCAPYNTPMFTKEMRDLLNSSVSDYEEDRVLNLDGDEYTNFAVYAEETVVIEENTGMNTVVSADDISRTYVIENADEQFTQLEEGNVVAYPYGDNCILIVKVASLAVEGSTVTIKGAELEMEEVFAYVKIEGESETKDAIVNDDTAIDGIEYEGLEATDDEVALFTEWGGSTSVLKHKYSISMQKEESSEYLDIAASINGTLKIEIPVSVKYYISLSLIHLEFRVDPSVEWSASIKGSVKGKLPLGLIHVYPVPGVAVGFSPDLVLEFEGEMSLRHVTESTIGMVYDSETGFYNLSTAPVSDTECKCEAELFFGIDFGPELKVLGPMAQVEFNAMVGIVIAAEDIGTGGETASTSASCRHSCVKCIHLELEFKVEIGADLSFLNGMLVLSSKRSVSTGALGTAYYSVDHDDFGLGNCPFAEYRITLYVKGADGEPVSGAKTVTSDGGNWGLTNDNGVAATYVSPGVYFITTTIGDTLVRDTIVVVRATKITITPNGKASVSSEGGSNTTMTEHLKDKSESQSGSFMDDSGGVLTSGRCGTNVRWEFSKIGILVIYGSGAMYDYSIRDEENNHAPWWYFRSNVKSVIVEDGVTHLGAAAFYECWELEAISIPDSVNSLGANVFGRCEAMTDIVLPQGVTAIPDGTFMDCDQLRNVTLPPVFTTIGSYAFYRTDIKEITIPDGVTAIGYYAFSCCNLTSVTIPGSVETIGAYGFSGCDKLSSVTLEEGVTTLGQYSFQFTALERVTIPDSVTAIGSDAFRGCDFLQEVHLGSGYGGAFHAAFSSCPKLRAITVSPDNPYYSGEDGVLFSKDGTCLASLPQAYSGHYEVPTEITAIGDHAFWLCTGLTSVSISAGVTAIGDDAFYNCTALTDIYFSGTEAQWNAVSVGCWGNELLESVTIHFAGETSSGEDGDEPTLADMMLSETTPDETQQDEVQLMSLFPGDHNSEFVGGVILRTASFSGLVPGADYVMLSLVSMDVEDILAAGNLLYVEQGTAGETGTLSFTYIQRVDTDPSYVMACGPTHWSIKDADVAVAEAYADGEIHLVMPAVSYNGIVLTENEDYVLLGDVDYCDAGTYAVIVRGIGNYTGEVECIYTVWQGVHISETEITFPEMYADGEAHLVEPTVSYNGTVLVEKEDFILVGDEEYSGVGTYTVTVCGIGEYHGEMVCTYTVKGVDIGDTEIVFSDMYASSIARTVAITVRYAGTELVLGSDYELFGDVEYTSAGDYKVTVRGIGKYVGEMERNYTVYPEGGFAMEVRDTNDGSIELWMGFYGVAMPEGYEWIMAAATYDGETQQMLSCDLLTINYLTDMTDLSLQLTAGMEHKRVIWKIFLLEGTTYLPTSDIMTGEINR